MEHPRDPGEAVPVRRMLWTAWVPVAWAFPPLLLLLRFTGGGGWETLFMLISAPVWWPALALLGLLPRFVLRRRGFTSVPVSVGIAIAGCMWGLLGFSLSLRGVGDSGSVDSALAGFVPGASARLQGTVAVVSMVLVAVAYVVAVVCAFALRRRDGAPEADRPFGGLALVLGIIAVPVVLGLVCAGLDRAAMHGARDAAGSQEADVVGLSAAQARARQVRHWDAAQRELEGARKAIGSDGWLVGTAGGVVEEDRRTEPYAYRVRVTWDRIEPGDPQPIGDRLLPLVEQQGWTPYESEDAWGKAVPSREILGNDDGATSGVLLHLRNRAGSTLDLSVSLPRTDPYVERPPLPAGSAIVTLELTGGRYWLEGRPGVDWYGEATSAEAEYLWGSGAPTFAFDAWPELRLVENQPATVQPR